MKRNSALARHSKECRIPWVHGSSRPTFLSSTGALTSENRGKAVERARQIARRPLIDVPDNNPQSVHSQQLLYSSSFYAFSIKATRNRRDIIIYGRLQQSTAFKPEIAKFISNLVAMQLVKISNDRIDIFNL